MSIRHRSVGSRILCIATLLLIATPCAPVLAWNFVGHKVTARITYYRLTPEARQHYVRIMRAHPALQRDLLFDMPADFGDTDLWAFMSAATWPDIIRDDRNPWNAMHHHPLWHYINMPFIPEGTDRALLRIPPESSTEWKTGTDPQNVIEALQKCTADLRDPNLADADKAVALSWYLHLAGDLHQPLHAFTLFSAQFPEGDRGGNQSMVLSAMPGIILPTSQPTTAATQPAIAALNLHFYWDNLLGRFGSPRTLEAFDHLATQPSSTTLRVDASPLDWAKESYELGKSAVTIDGKLPVADRGAMQADPTILPPALPRGYSMLAEEVGLMRVALAGRRMAYQLNDIVPQPAP